MVLINDTLQISDSVKIQHNGFAVFHDVKIADSGNIQVYRNFELSDLPDELKHKETLNIYRSPVEIKKSVNTFQYLAVTSDHPWDNVNIKNFKEYSVGLSSDAKFKKGDVIARSIVITDADMIVTLQSSEHSKELSCGYFAEIVYEAGTTDKGESYDGYMKNLEGNHIAVVERGKCGGSCRLW